MALVDDLKASFGKLDAETTAIGQLLGDLAGRLKGRALSPTEEADVFDALAALSQRLQALAVDPTNPVPPPTPAQTAALSKIRP